VTGDAVGQVSSQTLQNLAVISRAAERPILRPLVGANKDEILALARRIGTVDLSKVVGEYCALVPRRPATAAQLDLEQIPPGATAIDLRSRAEFDAWHAPDALHLPFPQALRAWPGFDRAQRYVLYCEIGLKSAHLAEQMREGGFEARHVRGGVRRLRRLQPD
jgi:thiamine biosynthesis protein ThiI